MEDPDNNAQPYKIQQMGNGVAMIDWEGVDLSKINDGIPVSKTIWSQNLNVQPGDKLHLAPFSKSVLYPIPKKVKTLKQMLRLINFHLNNRIDKQYKKIAPNENKFFPGRHAQRTRSIQQK